MTSVPLWTQASDGRWIGLRPVEGTASFELIVQRGARLALVSFELVDAYLPRNAYEPNAVVTPRWRRFIDEAVSARLRRNPPLDHAV